MIANETTIHRGSNDKAIIGNHTAFFINEENCPDMKSMH